MDAAQEGLISSGRGFRGLQYRRTHRCPNITRIPETCKQTDGTVEVIDIAGLNMTSPAQLRAATRVGGICSHRCEARQAGSLVVPPNRLGPAYGSHSGEARREVDLSRQIESLSWRLPFTEAVPHCEFQEDWHAES